MNTRIRTVEKTAEIAWFGDLCGGDTQYLGVLDNARRSNFSHCKNIVLNAENNHFNNILLPSSYIVGQDPFTFAGAIAPFTKRISLLVAHRFGELHPPMLARTISTLDHLLEGRFTLNVINSDLPGLKEEGSIRYQRTREIIDILKQAWTQDHIKYKGELYDFDLPSDPVKPYQQNGGPLLYFGGFSPEAREVCAQYCDVFLMWPDTEEGLKKTMQDVSAKAQHFNRTVDFGLRVHVIVRENEYEAHRYTELLLSKLERERGEELKNRSQDSKNMGVLHQDSLRQSADKEGYAEPLLWTGIGKARSGCGAALVGTPDQILNKINRYMDMGIRAFILSGYPLMEECNLFARYVLPFLPNNKLAKIQGRIPDGEPVTPLTTAVLK
jgi:alkanesulfonate monooxygenase